MLLGGARWVHTRSTLRCLKEGEREKQSGPRQAQGRGIPRAGIGQGDKGHPCGPSVSWEAVMQRRVGAYEDAQQEGLSQVLKGSRDDGWRAVVVWLKIPFFFACLWLELGEREKEGPGWSWRMRN